MYKYRKGLVVGKFSPLHAGHEHLIATALDLCEKLVIITYSNPRFPGCEPVEVERWLKLSFSDYMDRITIFAPHYEDIPDNDAAEYDHRDFCAKILTNNQMSVDAVVTSENYGDGFAKFLTRRFWAVYGMTKQKSVDHICVDINRLVITTSATSVRKEGVLGSKYVNRIVKSSFVPRVAFLGGESSGKTTLVNAVRSALPQRNVGVVYEYGRELYECMEGKLIFDDMLYIAQTQVEKERSAAIRLMGGYSPEKRNPLLLCDTTPATTMWYSSAWYRGNINSKLCKLAERKYDLTIICANDFEFVQDGTRIDAEFRQAAFDWYIHRQESLGLPYIVVTGTVEERVKQVLAAIDAM